MISRLLFLFFVVAIFALLILILDQIWFGFIAKKLFWKLIATISLAIVVAGILFAISNSFSEERRLIKERYYDK
jgi:hypothetical protein